MFVNLSTYYLLMPCWGCERTSKLRFSKWYWIWFFFKCPKYNFNAWKKYFISELFVSGLNLNLLMHYKWDENTRFISWLFYIQENVIKFDFLFKIWRSLTFFVPSVCDLHFDRVPSLSAIVVQEIESGVKIECYREFLPATYVTPALRELVCVNSSLVWFSVFNEIKQEMERNIEEIYDWVPNVSH